MEPIEFYKSKPAYEFKVKELTQLQRGHLTWRLDHKTGCGLITASHIGRGDGTYADMTLLEVFQKAGDVSANSAKSHSYKVLQYDNFGTHIKK